MKKMTMSVRVVNTAGVLTRVAGLFSRRNYNIDSLTVSATTDPNLSVITLVVTGEDEILEQIRKQVAKLEDVQEITLLKDGMSVCRELTLVKIAAKAEQRPQIIAITDIFRAKIVDVAEESLIIEITGNQAKLDAFIGLLHGFEIKELVRTGITGLPRGRADMLAGEFD